MNRPLALALGSLAASLLLLTAASAAPRRASPRPPPDAAAAPDAGPSTKEAHVAGDDAGARAKKPGEPRHPETVDAGIVAEAETSDGGTRVYRFGEVDIEGEVKSPELVFFARRLRSEIRAKPLSHRSFIPELKATRSDPTF